MELRGRLEARLGIWAAVVTISLFPGCSGGKPVVKLHQVSGKLVCDGKPVPNLIVTFVPEKGARSTAIVGPDGTFTLNYQKDVTGAVPGIHKVFVSYRPKSPEEEKQLLEGNLTIPADQKDALEKYGSLDSTTIKVTIDGDKNDLVISLD